MTEQPLPTDLGQQLAAHGAVPFEPDTESLKAQIAAMQVQLNQLLVERGVPIDPIAGAVKNLVDHVKARAAQYPQADLSKLSTALENLPESSDSITHDHALLIQNLVAQLHRNHAQFVHELSYLGDLALNLGEVVLEKAVA
jgi:hypothetical protein